MLSHPYVLACLNCIFLHHVAVGDLPILGAMVLLDIGMFSFKQIKLIFMPRFTIVAQLVSKLLPTRGQLLLFFYFRVVSSGSKGTLIGRIANPQQQELLLREHERWHQFECGWEGRKFEMLGTNGCRYINIMKDK